VSSSYSTGTVNGGDYVGGIAGYVGNGSIENSYSTGDVRGVIVAGGIAGCVSSGGRIANSYSAGGVGGGDFAGGVAGYVDNGGIENSYSTGMVSGTSFAGGIAGYADNGSIENCAALNPFVRAAENYAGRIAGYSEDGNTFTGNAAWDGMGTNGGVDFTAGPGNGTGVTTAQIRNGSGLPAAFKTGPWVYTAGKLPVLEAFAGQNDMPAHLE
jgi:hypothetical protein